VALERRNGSLYYYYRSKRSGERVRKVYAGSGELAQIAANEELIRRTLREGERERERAELEELKALAAPVAALCEATEILTRAHLVAWGYRKSQGKWRRARER
jgi:hypothetical protein